MERDIGRSGFLGKMVRLNPFFVASSVLILAGIALALNNDAFLESNETSLVFSMSSIQLYELCLVVGAVVLAKRFVHYDSLLLLVIEFVFLVIPFILITSALQFGDPLNEADWHSASVRGAVIAGSIAVGMVVLRMLYVSRDYPNLRLGRTFFILMGLILGVNLVAPMLLHFTGDPEMDTARERYVLLKPMFYYALPVLAALGNLLPRPKMPRRALPQQQPWIPFVGVASLVVMTVFNLVWLRFVHCVTEPLTVGLFLPVSWALVWTLWNRAEDYVTESLAAWRYRLHWLPFFVTIGLLPPATRPVAVVLVLANVVVYGWLAWSGKYARSARIMAFLSFVSVLCTNVHSLFGAGQTTTGPVMDAPLAEPTAVAAEPTGLWLWVLASLLLIWRSPAAGIVGSYALGVLTYHYQPGPVELLQPAVAVGIGALTIHSFRWKTERYQLLAGVRSVFASLVCGGVFYASTQQWGDYGFQLVVLVCVIAVASIRFFLLGQREILPPLILSTVGLLSLPGRGVAFLVRERAYSPLVTGLAFIVFGIGLVQAMRKRKLAANGGLDQSE